MAGLIQRDLTKNNLLDQLERVQMELRRLQELLLTQEAADLRYLSINAGDWVEVTGDTMTGKLLIEVATAAMQALQVKTTDDDPTYKLIEVLNGSNTVLSYVAADGRFFIPVGSASAPGMAFIGDSNTGISSPDVDRVAMVGGGVARWILGQYGRFELVTDQLNANTDSAQSLLIHNNGSLTVDAGSSQLDLSFGGTTRIRIGGIIRVGELTIGNGHFNISATSTSTDLLVLTTMTSFAASVLRVQDASGNFKLGIDANGRDITFDSTTGSKIGTATSQKLGFYGATPITQPVGANQATITDNTTGSVGNSLEYFYGEGVVDETPINDNFATLDARLNQVISDLVALGLLKGSA